MTKASTEHYSVLLIEGNAADVEFVSDCLLQSELTRDICVAANLSEGRKALAERAFDLVFLDGASPGSDPAEAVREIVAVASDSVVIVLTEIADEAGSVRLMDAGAQDYLSKDEMSGPVLRRSIRYTMERMRLVKNEAVHTRDLEHQVELLRRIFDSSIDSMLILSPEYEIKFLNSAATELLGGDADSLIGAIFPFSVQRGEQTELEIPGPGDSTRIVELNAVDLMWEQQGALLITLRDRTDRRQAELALECEKERLSVILESIADAVIAADQDNVVERINQEASRLIGISHQTAVGRPLGDVLKFKDANSGQTIRNPLDFLSSTGQTATALETGISLARKDGEEVFVTAEMRCILDEEMRHRGCVIVLRDVTAHKRAEEELFKAEKLNSISLLAGGIAHDFNNILTAVLGNISVVRMGMDESHSSARRLLSAEKAALQAKTLTQQLLTFSKGGAPVLEATTIDQLVEDYAQFILRGSNVRCEIEKDPNLWAVDADRGQIAQVVNNLIINADQSMPKGGVIRLVLTNEAVHGHQVPALPRGDYVCITVKDDGVGISPENLNRVFDPYFTTKEIGNGLGLASSYSTVKSHRGLMTVESKIGVGSTFRVYLPKTAQPVGSAKEPEEEDTTIHSGKGRILVMDDMEAMMLVAGEIISMLGYEVEFSRNGTEAIELYKKAKESGNPFDAVVFDLTVPGGMGGEEACGILRQYDPDLIAIASSGYTTSNVMSDFKNAGFNAVVPKPYRIKEMSDVLHRVLQ